MLLNHHHWASKGRMTRQGFSLLEVMIVLLLIAMMSTMVVLASRSYLSSGRRNAVISDIAQISEALETYEATYGHFPGNDEGLEALVTPTDEFPGGLIKRKSAPVDPWGNPYQYNYPGRSLEYDVICFGKDGQPGGEGSDKDISNEELIQ